MPGYAERLHTRCRQLNTCALVGLDPRWDMLPEEIRAAGDTENQVAARATAYKSFCMEIVDIVAPLVPAVKPQVAFFESLGPAGMLALQQVILYARDQGLVVIADAKRGDIGSTAQAYADTWLAGEDPDAAPYAADALTVNPYLGEDTLQPFVDACVQRRAGLYVLVRTSNPGAAVFQDRVSEDQKLFEGVADVVQGLNQSNWEGDDWGGIGAVTGATWPAELTALRERMPNTPLLIPGYGSQGGTAEDVQSGIVDGVGALINSSRGINFAYRKEEFSDMPWRDAIQAATVQMIEDLSPRQTGG